MGSMSVLRARTPCIALGEGRLGGGGVEPSRRPSGRPARRCPAARRGMLDPRIWRPSPAGGRRPAGPGRRIAPLPSSAVAWTPVGQRRVKPPALGVDEHTRYRRADLDLIGIVLHRPDLHLPSVPCGGHAGTGGAIRPPTYVALGFAKLGPLSAKNTPQKRF